MADNENKALNGEESELHDEMEELARIFREELGKAQQEAEENESFEAEVDLDTPKYQVEGYAVTTGEKNSKEDVILCECCKEKPAGTKKDPNSPFCEDCESIMEKYPYDWKGIIALIAVLVVMVISFATAFELTPVFANVAKGNKALNQNKLYSAQAYYKEASEYITNNKMALKFNTLTRNKILVEYKLASMSDALEIIQDNYDVKNIKDKKVAEVFTEIRTINASNVMIEEHLSKYYEYDASEKYDEIIKLTNSMIGKKIYVTDTECHDELQEDFKPTGEETVLTYDEGWVRLFQYSVALTAGKEEDSTMYLEKAINASSSLDSLAAPLLAQTYIGNGNYEKATEIINRVKSKNAEGAEYYMLLSMLSRYKDKNYEAAKDICITGLENLSYVYKSSDLIAKKGAILSMQKTLAYIMANDYKSAYTSANECYQFQIDAQAATIQARDLYAMLAIATGDDETFKEIEAEIASYQDEYDEDFSFTQDVKDYQAGKITLQEIAMSGRYDLV